MLRRCGMGLLRALLCGLLLIGLLLGAMPTVTVRAAAVTANIFTDPTPGTCATSGTGNCSLREAILFANANSGITVTLLGGVYTLSRNEIPDQQATTGPVKIAANMTIVGGGQDVTIIDGGGVRQTGAGTLTVNPGAIVSMTNLIVRNGKSRNSGAGITNGGMLTLQSCTITGNLGGGVFNSGTLTINESIIRGNTNDTEDPSYSSLDGVGIRNSGLASNIGKLVVTNSTISDNTGGYSGGGIYSAYGSVALTNVVMSGNVAGQGAGIISWVGTLSLNNVTISGNQSAVGGGIDLPNGTATVANSTISGNTATYDSGGIRNGDGTVTVTHSTISGNRAEKGGGIGNFGTLTVDDSTLSGNVANTLGGALYIARGTASFQFSTLAANSSGIGIEFPGGPVTLRGTLLANTGANCSELITSNDYNLSNDASCDAAFTQAHDRRSVNPQLGPLTNNGGPTQTMAPLPGSPAIDAGGTSANGCPATDQRGAPRPHGAMCDIGAVESGATVAPTLSASGTSVPFGQNRVTLTFATGDGSSGTVCVAANGGAEVPFAGGASGTATASFINSGAYAFILHAGAGCTGAPLASVTVTKLNPKGTTGPAILATPAIFSFATSTTQLVRSSTISFDTGDGSVGQVLLSVNGGPPQTFAAAQFGTSTAPWVFSGTYTFTLVKGGQTVDTATVTTTAEISSPNGTTAGGPSPNVSTTNGTPVLLTFDTGNGQPAALCTQFGGLVSFSQNGSGYANVNNAGAIIYDLHIGSCTGPRATQGTVTVTST